MEKQEYMQESMDMKRLLLILIRKIWYMLLITAAGAAIGALIYYGYTNAKNGEPKYVVKSDYYITFNDKEYPNGVDFYNAYTWDSILRDDPIVDVAVENLGGSFTKEEVKAAVSGEMLGDYRILTVNVVTASPELSQTIADAYTYSLDLFAEKIDMLTSVALWSQEAPALLEENTRGKNAAILGGLIGALLSIFIFVLLYILDDSVYVEHDFTKRYPNLPFLGTVTDKKNERFLQGLIDNYNYICGQDKHYYFVQVAFSNTMENPIVPTLNDRLKGTDKQLTLAGESFETIRNCDGAIILIPYAQANGKLLEKTIDTLTKQNCHIAGVIVTDASDSFLKQYYLGRRNK